MSRHIYFECLLHETNEGYKEKRLKEYKNWYSD